MTAFLSHRRAKGFYQLHRPLLELSRDEVTFLTTCDRLPISVDSTNQLGQSTRSQIRYLVLPLISRLGFTSFEENFDPLVFKDLFSVARNDLVCHWVDRDSNPEPVG